MNKSTRWHLKVPICSNPRLKDVGLRASRIFCQMRGIALGVEGDRILPGSPIKTCSENRLR